MQNERTSRRAYVLEGAIYVAFLVVTYVFFGGILPIVRFESEVVRITADGQRLFVDVTFRYRNPWPFRVTQGFSCPTPQGEGLRPVTEVFVERVPLGTGGKVELIPVRYLSGTPYFETHLPGGTEVDVRVRYVQGYNGRVGRYLLTTTSAWGRPLDHGRYELTLVSVELKSSNYVLEQIGPGRYTFEMSNFMPNRDWIFETNTVGGQSCAASR